MMLKPSRNYFIISKIKRKLSLEDVSGSTFTISNNGSFNSLTSTIINQPNVAILSTESVKKKAVVVESEGMRFN